MASSISREPTEEEITKEYELRRITALRRLAHEANDILRRNFPVPPTIDGKPVTNLIITNVEDRNADYLWFALKTRQRWFTEEMQIPEYVGFGAPYDSIFDLYTNYYNFKQDETVNEDALIPEYPLPLLMLKHPDKLWFVYANLFIDFYQIPIERCIRSLLRGTARDKILMQWLEKIEAIKLKKKRTWDFTPIYKEMIAMMENGEFDVLDSIYIILESDNDYDVDEHKEPVSRYLSTFRKIVS
jgi:hypothetical protein